MAQAGEGNTRPGGAKNVARAQRKPKVRAIKAKPQSPAAARAQERQYVSQGAAVERAASAQKRAVRTRQAQVKDSKDAADLGRASSQVVVRDGHVFTPNARGELVTVGEVRTGPLKNLGIGPTKLGERTMTVGEANPKRAVKQAAALAPALKVIDQTTRPVHAIAGGARAAIKGENIPSAIGRGAALKDRYLFGDALKAAGVHGAAANIAGFGLDVVADPTTYATFGAGSVASRAAERAAAGATKRAVKAGMSAEGGAIVAKVAGKRAAAAAPEGSGLTVKFAGRELPGVRRATAVAGRAVKAPARRVAPVASRTVPAKARDVAREVRPMLRPAGVSQAEFEGTRQAARQARATVNNAEVRAQQLARDVHRTIPAEQYQTVIDAIERNDLSGLPTDLARAAHDLRSALKGAYRQAHRAGAVKGKVGDAAEFLTSADLKRLRRAVKAEPGVQRRRLTEAQKRELHARGRAEIEARERAAVIARRVRATEDRHPDVILGQVAGKRVERELEQTPSKATRPLARLERRRGDVQLAEQRVKAAAKVPSRGLVESHEQYLKRLVSYARQHDLRLLERRATKLLDSAPTDVAKGYFPRDFDDRVLKQLGLADTKPATRAGAVTGGPARAVSKATSGFARSEKRVLSAVNPKRVEAGQVPFSTNVPLVALNQLKQSARATSQGQFAQRMAALGRRITSAADLHPDEGLYKLGYRAGQFGLHEVNDVPKHATRGGQYVALHRGLVEEMQGATRQVRAGSQAGRALDKTTGAWKRIATATPAFHIRNIIGDTQQAYTAAPHGHQLPRNVAQAGKAVRRANQQTKTLRPAATDKTIKVAGQRQPIDEFLKGAREHGVIDSGYIGRELRDLTGQASEKAARATKRGTSRAGQTVERWMANRENLLRLATYKAGLDHGMSAAEAASHANLFHVDYGELSELERKALRRAFPFYTWTARTLPVTAKVLVTRPGKFANLEKAREETGGAFTGETEQQQRSRMTAQQQRQLPFVIKGPNGISASLPATLLNELPTGASTKDVGDYLDEIGRFGFQMLTPAAKIPIELRTGVSTFTRQPIEDEKRPLVSAPAWVQYLPAKAKQALDVTPNYIDKRTGKKTWGWRGRADYASHQIPGAPQQISTLASGARPGQPKSTGAAISSVLGVRVDSLGPQAQAHAKQTKLFKHLAALNRRAGILNQQGINADNATPEYRQLRQKINALEHQLGTRQPKARKRSVDLLGSSGAGQDLLSTGSDQVDLLK